MRPYPVRRALTIHLGAALSFTLLAAAAGSPAHGAAPAATNRHSDLRTRNVILITIDGLRIQEMFGGMDPIVSENDKRSGIYDLERARARYWRPTREERREALMPYFWRTIAPRGIVFGDKEKGSSVLVTNPLLFSAPGYAEILTGRPQADVTTNDVKRYAHPTILEFARRELGLDGRQVATFGSWEGFKTLSSSHEGDFFTNAGYERIPPAMATPRMALLSDLQFQVMALWEEGRSDAITFGLAVEYLKRQRPRLLYIALGEPDDWAHARRYDRLLDYLQVLDGYLRELWQTLEASDSYRGRTTVILTTDHGRGVRPSDWVEHGEGIEGSQDIWIAVVGPDTPRLGDAAPSAMVHQADVAATLLRFLGLDPAKFDPQAGPPIAAAFAR